MSKVAVAVGFLFLIGGVALIHYPSALILCGAMLMVLGVFYDDGK